MTDKNSTLYLIDGSSYLFRAYHALPPLTNALGQPTGAIYGVINMIRKLLDEKKPQFIAVVFDAKGPTFRKDMYPEYKANRPPMPDDLRCQIEPLHELIQAMGLPLIIKQGVEADDVIATLAKQAEKSDQSVVISSGDKDLAQLVNENVCLINTMNNTVLDIDGVINKFGVKPDQIVDYLTLIGDSSDNVPGVPKVGPKTAAKWLNEFDNLDQLVQSADSLKGKVGESFKAHLDKLALSKELVTLKMDVQLEQKPQQLTPQPINQEKLQELLTQLGFTSWLSNIQISGVTAQPTANNSVNYELILEKQAFKRWLDKLNAAEAFAIDTETDSLNYMQANLVGICLSVTPGEAAYIPVAHNFMGAPEQLDRDWVLAQLKPILADENKIKIGQHIKYDMNVLARYGVVMSGVKYDSMLESYVLNSTASRHDMDSLALNYLGIKTTKYEEIVGKGAKQITFDQVDLETATHYAAEDADITLQLHQCLWEKLSAQPQLKCVYESIEQPLIKVLAAMEQHGVLLDCQQLSAQSQEIATRIQQLETTAHKIAGAPFNLSSPKQLQEILYEKQQIPVIRKTPKGAPSTAEDVLQELANEHALPATILEYRSLSKLKSTYTDRLPGQVDVNTGRVHTSYHQAIASTGRLSSSDPNLQNIPIRTAEGRRIRQAFIAPIGYKLLASDYSQIELRIMAHLSQDPALLSAFKHNMDVHAATAAEVFGVDPDNVDANHRRIAKAINFGLMYGMSAFGLAKQLHLPRGEAQCYIDIYFSRYKGVASFIENTKEQARKQGYVETIQGRRLYLAEINSKNHSRRMAAERIAINAPMQGSAADIIKIAMINVFNWLTENHPDCYLLMQVHDELVFEIPEQKIEAVQSGIDKIMCNAVELSVPLVVDHGVGNNWDEAH